MISFREYITRRDEASFNPFNRGQNPGSELGQAIKTITGYPIGIGAAGIGALGGAGEIMPAYRQHTTGNPYISPEEANRPKGMPRPHTEQLARRAFDISSNFLLDFIAKEPERVKGQYIATLHNEHGTGILDQVHNYIKKGERAPTKFGRMQAGQRAGMLSNIFALPMAFIRGVKHAVINAWDSFNPEYDIAKEWPIEVQKMIYALDAMMTVPNGGGEGGLADSYIEELIFNLGEPSKVRQLGRQ